MPNWTSNYLTLTGSRKDILGFLEQAGIKPGDAKVDFDFNKWIPMPKELNVPEGSERLMAYDLVNSAKTNVPTPFKDSVYGPYFLRAAGQLPDEQDRHAAETMTAAQLVAYIDASTDQSSAMQRLKSIVELGRVCHENAKNHGFPSWLDWCIHSWGPKWNACDTEVLLDDAILQPDGDDSASVSVEISFNTAWSCPLQVFEAIHKANPSLRGKLVFHDEDEYEECELDFGPGIGFGEIRMNEFPVDTPRPEE